MPGPANQASQMATHGNPHAMMQEAQLQITTDGAILFDAGAAAQAGAHAFVPEWFDADYWRAQQLAVDETRGRGNVTFVHAAQDTWVLRHYRRGGMVARVLGDRYLWTGVERTRGFCEFRLLRELHNRGIDVPTPVAARYRRHGMHYRADLITRRIADTQTLAEQLLEGALSCVSARVGAAVARLHAAGGYHADLNAHNILLDARTVWIIDFDRGELRAPARSWQLANLQRLRRSLIKLGGARDGEARFDRECWQPLMVSYEERLREFRTRSSPSAYP